MAVVTRSKDVAAGVSRVTAGSAATSPPSPKICGSSAVVVSAQVMTGLRRRIGGADGAFVGDIFIVSGRDSELTMGLKKVMLRVMMWSLVRAVTMVPLTETTV